MKRRTAHTITIAAFLALTLYGCGDERGAGGVRARPPAPVRVWMAERADVAQRIAAVGTVEPDEDVTVSAEVEARLVRIVRDEGDLVERGDTLAVLDQGGVRLAAEKKKADLKKARADLEFAENDFERKKSLFDDGVISKEAYEEALARRDSARGGVGSEAAALELALKDIADSRVRAPFSGYIAERYVAVGSYVREGDRLFRIMDTDPVKVSARVPERHMGLIRQGQELSLRARSTGDGGDGDGLKGKIYYISPHVDEKTRSFEIKARIANPRGALKPGLFADVTVLTGIRKGVFMLPEKAVVSRENRDVIFVVIDGKAAEKAVTVIDRQDGRVMVETGIEEGEAVVIDGAHNIKAGAQVNVIDGGK